MWVKICNKAIVNSLRCHEQRTGLFIHKYTTVPGWRLTIPSAHLWLYLLPPPAAATLHPTPLPIDPALPYSSTLHYPPYSFHNPCSYTQSPHESLCPLPCASYASPADTTQVLTLVYGCKIEKERAVAHCLFSMPENPYGRSCNPAHGQSSTG